ncbi:quinon protein alcohol dehydrogenase-like superfamily [Baffinella frigidus]|nr:quinon protein alcohol dehydrogenase-like superfamily [Cryptophyta sp. CCMP2293]
MLYAVDAHDGAEPQPSTLNPQPSTLNPQPSTLNQVANHFVAWGPDSQLQLVQDSAPTAPEARGGSLSLGTLLWWHNISSNAYWAERPIKWSGDGKVIFAATETHLEALAASNGTTLLNQKPETRNSKLETLNPKAETRWTFARGSVVSTPAIHPQSGVLYVASDDTLYAVAWVSGQKEERVLWTFFAGSGMSTSPPALSPAGDVVYCFAKNGAELLYAVSALDGSEIWRYSVTSSMSTSQPRGPITVSRDGNKLVAVNSDGTARWTHGTGNAIVSSATTSYDDATVFFTCWDGYLYAVNAQTGERRWRVNTGDHYAPPLLSRDGAVVMTNSGGLHAHDSATGVLLWKSNIPDNTYYSVGCFSADDSTVFMPFGRHADNKMSIGAFNRSTGELQWSAEVDGGFGFHLSLSPDGTMLTSGSAAFATGFRA